MSSEEEIKNIKIKLNSAADSIRDFMLQLGKLRQDLLNLSSNLEKLTITHESEKDITKISELPPPPTPKSPSVSTPKPAEVTSIPKTVDAVPKKDLKAEQKVPEKVIAPPTAKEPTSAPVQKPLKAPVTETAAAPKPIVEQLKTEQLKSVSDLGTSAIPLNKVVSLLNELEQLCEGSLPAEEVANKIESTKKSLQSLVLYHPVYYEMDKTIKNFRTTSPKQPLNPTDKAMLLSKIPEWKKRMM
ncbi:MAG: hypothetical protein WED07_05175 [Candidatus Freyarchaeum deiterrae]